MVFIAHYGSHRFHRLLQIEYEVHDTNFVHFRYFFVYFFQCDMYRFIISYMEQIRFNYLLEDADVSLRPSLNKVLIPVIIKAETSQIRPILFLHQN